MPETEGQMGDGLEGEIGTLVTNTIYILITSSSSMQLTYPLLEVCFLLENKP